jgi:predicted negative regulator of RcsB-dependent stress response
VQLAKGETAAALATVTAATPGAFNARYQELRGDILLAKGDRVGALREYLAAKAAETAPDSEVTLDMPGLDLKIDDLRADGIEAPAAAAAKATNPAPTPAAQP